MKSGALGAIVLMMMLLVATFASAQTEGIEQRPIDRRYIDTRQGVSLVDAVAGALEREPSLGAARAELEAARGLRQQAGLYPDPSMMLERREEPGGSDNLTTVQITFPLELFRRSARVAAADREIDVVDRSVADRRRMVANDVRVKYGRAAAAVRNVTVAENLAASGRRELELLRRRVEEGAAPPLDRDRLEVEVRRIDAARLLATGRADAAMLELQRALGVDAGHRLLLGETLEMLAPNAPAGTTPVDERPDIREGEARLQLADARIERAEADGRLDVGVFGSFMRMDAGFPQRGLNENGELERIRGVFRYVSVGAMVTLPLWNRNRGEVAAARAELTAATARLNAARLTAESEIAAAAARDTQAVRALGLMAEAVALARKNLDIVQQTYELGRGTLTDVVEERRRYLDVEQEYTAALLESFDARASLQFARGETP